MIVKEDENIKIYKGNIFTTKCQTIVNAVNCVGVMGAGIAYEFKLRHPDMFDKYIEICRLKKLEIGKMWIFNNNKNGSNYSKILNFPTKHDWKYPTKIEYLEKGLQKFVETYEKKRITSIAFPLLGSQKGGLSQKISEKILIKYLKGLKNLEVEIWYFNPIAKDDLYENFKKKCDEIGEIKIASETKIRKNIIKKIIENFDNKNINSITGLLQINGVGKESLFKLFNYIKTQDSKKIIQKTL